MTVSGLSRAHAREAVRLVQQAAVLGYHNRDRIHYTEGELRWNGIDRHRVALKGEYPAWADCSAFATWCLCNALHYKFGLADHVNGLDWRAGYTGTLLQHGQPVSEPSAGDLIIYGPGTGSHTAVYTGGGLVVSHGSESGPLLLPWTYRGDVHRIHRYI